MFFAGIFIIADYFTHNRAVSVPIVFYSDGESTNLCIYHHALISALGDDERLEYVW